MRSTSSWFTDLMSERSMSGVIRAPALRMTWISPASNPKMARGSIRQSMQVTTARCCCGIGESEALGKLDAYALFPSTRSLKESTAVILGGEFTELDRLPRIPSEFDVGVP